MRYLPTLLATGLLLASACSGNSNTTYEPSASTALGRANSPTQAKLRLEPKAVSLIGAIHSGRHPCPHAQNKNTDCLTDDIQPAAVTVQESDGYKGPFTFTVANPNIAVATNNGDNSINVVGQNVGATTITVTGDKGASAPLRVDVTETDIYLKFFDVPYEVYYFQVSSPSGPTVTYPFPEAGPIKYHFNIYDYPLAPNVKGGTMVSVSYLDVNMQYLGQQNFQLGVIQEDQDNKEVLIVGIK